MSKISMRSMYAYAKEENEEEVEIARNIKLDLICCGFGSRIGGKNERGEFVIAKKHGTHGKHVPRSTLVPLLFHSGLMLCRLITMARTVEQL